MSNTPGIAQFIGYTFGTIAISFLAAYGSMYCMDWCTRPAERRRAIERAAAQESSQQVHEKIMDILFPPNKTIQSSTETTPNMDIETCAICIEPFQTKDEILTGGICHHTYHRSCMLEWLKVHKECPTCRKDMWTEESRFQAKKKLLEKNPDILKMELALMGVEEKQVRVQRLSLENPSPSQAVTTFNRETEDTEETQDQLTPIDLEEQRDNPLDC